MKLSDEPFNWNDAIQQHYDAEWMRQEIHRMTINLSNPAYCEEWEQIQRDLHLYIGLYRTVDYDVDERVVEAAEHALANPKDPLGPEVVENYWRSVGVSIELIQDGSFDSSLDGMIEKTRGLLDDKTQPEYKREPLQYKMRALQDRRLAVAAPEDAPISKSEDPTLTRADRS